MAVTDFESNPAAWDFPIIAGERVAGTRVYIVSGGDKEREVKEMTSPDTLGAYTVGGKVLPVLVTYRIECARRKDREEVYAWMDWFDEMLTDKPLPALDITDPNLPPGITQVVPIKLSAWKLDSKSKMNSVEFTVKQWLPRRLYSAGPAVPKDANDKKIEDEEKSTADKKADRDRKTERVKAHYAEWLKTHPPKS